ncbi:MAG TPA: PIG-L family deacetylase [Candidatus Limnocylindrales bacterium]|nr:PIG-L family deacetylase [Candidatus Limnocylindrales bacterium]
MPVEDALTRRPVLLVVAHPDDETVSAGGVLSRMRNPVIVTVTDGAPRDVSFAREAGYKRREDYAAARRQELLNAMEIAHITERQLRSFDLADQEAMRNLPELTKRTIALIAELRPGTILTHPYEGGHPDHDAIAFAVHAACALVPTPPEIVEFTSYHASPSHTDPDKAPAWEISRFLPGYESGETIVLTKPESRRKQQMLECYGSQAAVLHRFAVGEETFRPAPVYDFTKAPHPGILLYETFGWGVDGTEFRRYIAEAMKALHLEGAL